MIHRSCLRPVRQLAGRPAMFTRQLTVRTRGLKKTDADYMISSTGVEYPGNETTLEPVKQLLGGEYSLPDQTILQILTHKSFAHAKKPFNEGLSDLGGNFLRLSLAQYAVKQPTQNPAAIAECNFDIDPRALDTLTSVRVLHAIAQDAQIDKTIFWKNPHPTQPAHRSGEASASAKAIAAMVGAVYLHHGQQKAIQFVQDRLVNSSMLDNFKQVFKP